MLSDLTGCEAHTHLDCKLRANNVAKRAVALSVHKDAGPQRLGGTVHPTAVQVQDVPVARQRSHALQQLLLEVCVHIRESARWQSCLANKLCQAHLVSGWHRPPAQARSQGRPPASDARL